MYTIIIHYDRGETFRRLLLRIGEIRSLLPAHAKIMALTATATAALRMEVSKIVGMREDDMSVVSGENRGARMSDPLSTLL